MRLAAGKKAGSPAKQQQFALESPRQGREVAEAPQADDGQDEAAATFHVGDTVLVPANGLPCVGDSLGGMLVKGVIFDKDSGDGLIAQVRLHASRAAGWVSGGEWRGNAAEIHLANTAEQLEAWSGDLAELPVKGEENAVDALRFRWTRGVCCAQIRGALISINPLGAGADAPEASSQPPGKKAAQKVELGIDSFCSRVLTQKGLTGRSAAIVFNGESGGGKTTAARHCCARARGTVNTVATHVGRASAVVFEAFGNAATLANDDASRCGVFRQIWPASRADRARTDSDSDDDLESLGFTGGACSSTPFLLERSRVASFHERERSFHIFYQMLAGLPVSEKQEMKLGMLPEYTFLKHGLRRLKGVDDAKRFADETLPALTAIGLSKATVDDLLKALGGVLACGNLVWEDAAATGASCCKSATWLDRVGFGLGVTADQLKEAMAVGRVSAQTLRLRTAELACGVYDGVFRWLVQRANQAACEVQPTEPWVGIVDMFGTEKLVVNNFEQLLANHVGERLYGLYIRYSLEPMRDAEWSKSYPHIEVTSNERIIELIEGTSASPGVLQLLDRRGDGVGITDDAIGKAVHELLKDSKMYSIGQDKRGFRIHHSFRDVEYTTAGFSQRNLNRMEAGKGLAVLLSKSTNFVIREAFQPRGGRVRSARQDEASVGCRLAFQLQELQQQLLDGATDLHFVHCLRSSWGFLSKDAGARPTTFQWDCVYTACHGLGIFDACRLHWAIAERTAALIGANAYGNFVYRRRHTEFLADYGALVVPKYWELVKRDPAMVIRQLLEVAPESSYFVGGHMVGMQPKCVQVLDEHRNGVASRLSQLARQVQTCLRARIELDRIKVQRETTRVFLPRLQAMTRRRLQLAGPMARERAKKQVLGVARLMQAVVALRPRMQAALLIQRIVRGMQARRWLRNRRLAAAAKAAAAREEVEAAIAAQAAGASVAEGVDEQSAENTAAAKIQSRWRGRKARADDVNTEATFRASRMLVSVLKTFRERCDLVVRLGDDAAGALQVMRRKKADRRHAENLREEEAARELVLGTLRALKLRCELADINANDMSKRLQSAWVDKQERDEKAREVQAKEGLEVFTACGRTLSLRLALKMHRLRAAASIIYRRRMRVLNRRRIRAACVSRLQDMLSANLHRLEARRLLERLRARLHEHRKGSVVAGALKALAVRLRLDQRLHARLTAGAMVLQSAHRGAATRRELQLHRLSVAKLDLQAASRRYEAWQVMQRLQDRGAFLQAAALCRGMLQAMHLRMRLRHAVQERRAGELLTRMARGWVARRQVRQQRREEAMHHSCQLLSSIWARYCAEIELARLQSAHAHKRATELWRAAILTLEWRIVHTTQCQAVRRRQATQIMEGIVRMVRVRRSQPFKAAGAARSRVRLELADEALQNRHLAALVVQKAWRRFYTTYREILPRLVFRLSAERSVLQAACEREARGLPALGAGRMRPLGVRALREAYRPQNVFRPKEEGEDATGWLNTMARVGEGLADLGFGAAFALGVGVSGAAYLCNIRGGISRLTLRGPRYGQGVQVLAEAPRVVRVACGHAHAVLMTDTGYAFGWGANDHGQCGIGDLRSGDPVIAAVQNPTSVHPWRPDGEAPASEDRTGRGGLPRVEYVTCGRHTSAAITRQGALWMWGHCEELGLPRLRVAGAMPAAAEPIPPFMLFSVQSELPIEREQAWSNVAKCEEMEYFEPLFSSPGSPRSGLGHPADTWLSLARSVGDASPRSDTAGSGAPEALSTSQMLRAIADVALEEAPGDAVAPAICGCVLSPLSGRERGRGPGFVRLPGRRGAAAAFVAARAGGAEFAQVCLGEDGANFVVTRKHRIYSWGTAPSDMLGRPPPPGTSPGEPLTPLRLPMFLNLSIGVQSVAVGTAHVAVATTHGRVFTWGELEACLADSGFGRRAFSEPIFVSGALRDVRVGHIAAGLLETAVSAHQAETFLGWELLEMAPSGNKFLPAVYHYTRAAKGRCTRLAMQRSQALQVLIADIEDSSPTAARTAKKPGIFVPPDRNWRSHRFSATCALPIAGSKPRAPVAAPASASVNASLFRWAETLKAGDVPPKLARTRPLPLSACSVLSIMNPKELVEIDRRLAGFRRLADQRSKAKHLWGENGSDADEA